MEFSPLHNPGEKRRSHIVRHLAVVGSKGVRPGAQHTFVCNVRFDEQNTEFPGQLVEQQAVEEGIVLLSPGAEAQVKSSDGFREAAG